jgi:phosphate transport system protein
MTTDHSVKSYDAEFQRLDQLLIHMTDLASDQCGKAVAAIISRNVQLGTEVVARDAEVNRLAEEVEALCLRMLALRQPMGRDLRSILSCLRISVEVERIADYAGNIAKRARHMDQHLPCGVFDEIAELATVIRSMIREAQEAFRERSSEKAVRVWHSDDGADAVYIRLIAELRAHMAEGKDPQDVTACTHLLFVAKSLERMGDHITNVAEQVYFLATGEKFHESDHG